MGTVSDSYKHQRQKYHRQMVMNQSEAQQMTEKTHVLSDPEINEMMDDIINSAKSGTASELLATFAADQPRIDLRKKKTLDNFQLRKDLIHNEKNLTIEYNIYLRDIQIGFIKPEHSPIGVDIKFYSDFPNVIPNAKAASVNDMLKLLTNRIEATRDFIRLFEYD